jgi:ribosome-associated protein
VIAVFGRKKKPAQDPAQEPAVEAGPPVDDVPIREDMIRLGQFLKLANLVEHGGEAKEVIAAGEVTVNGEVDVRRGRQLHVGDVVQLRGQYARPVDEADFEDNLPW